MIGMTTVDKEGRAKIESVILVPKDYVQVVRCKDCINWDKNGFCGITGREEPKSHYDEDTATEIKFLERLYEKVSADMRGAE